MKHIALYEEFGHRPIENDRDFMINLLKPHVWNPEILKKYPVAWRHGILGMSYDSYLDDVKSGRVTERYAIPREEYNKHMDISKHYMSEGPIGQAYLFSKLVSDLLFYTFQTVRNQPFIMIDNYNINDIMMIYGVTPEIADIIKAIFDPTYNPNKWEKTNNI